MKIALIIVSCACFALLLIVYFVLGRLDWYRECYYVEVAKNNELRNKEKDKR